MSVCGYVRVMCVRMKVSPGVQRHWISLEPELHILTSELLDLGSELCSSQELCDGALQLNGCCSFVCFKSSDKKTSQI